MYVTSFQPARGNAGLASFKDKVIVFLLRRELQPACNQRLVYLSRLVYSSLWLQKLTSQLLAREIVACRHKLP